MIEESSGFPVQSLYRAHILVAQFEVENREILDHPFLLHRLRDHHDPSLDMPPKDDLRDGLPVLGSNRR